MAGEQTERGRRLGREQRQLHPERRRARHASEHAVPDRVGHARTAGRGPGGFGDREPRGRISHPFAIGRRALERSGLHRARIPARVLPALSRILRVLSALGARGLPHSRAPRTLALSTLGVVAALNAEARTLGPAMPRSDGLSLLGDGALLAVSGMGGALAAGAARRLLEAGAAALMSFGLAGGLDPALGAGAVVLPREIVSRGGARFAVS